jgi:putative two-component system response regulator
LLPRILIVDDEIINLQVAASYLQSTRLYTISVAKSGKEALELMGIVSPQLILLDVIMPEMNGFQICRVIKDNAEWKDIPVIFLSGVVSDEDRKRCFEVGGVDYLMKPVEQKLLLGKVATYL